MSISAIMVQEVFLAIHMGGRSTLALIQQNIIDTLYLYAGLENGLEWWNGLWNGL